MLTAVVLVAVVALAGTPQRADANTVRQATARWADGTVQSVPQGDVLNSEWRFNLNDSAPAAANNEVDNVYVTITAANGTLKQLPDSCLTEGVNPASAILDGGTSVLCNFGSQKQGTAIAIEVPVVATGPVGSAVQLSAAFGEASAQTTTIPIVKGLSVDFKLSEPDAWYQATGVNNNQRLEFPWSVTLGNGSQAGPDTLVYSISTSVNSGALLTAGNSFGCAPFTSSTLAASGHPWSGGGHPSDQTASFVGSCTLTANGSGTFTLTLTGVDWSTANAPVKDSAGAALPADRSVVASGILYFEVAPASGAVSTVTMGVTASAPTYRAAADPSVTANDDPSNNTATKIVPLQRGWSGIWSRTSGSSWDDQLRRSAGSPASTYMSATLNRSGVRASQCTVLDTKYVTFGSAAVGGEGGTADKLGPYVVSYYTGGASALDPASASYDPNAVTTCGALNADGWTTTLPADLSSVRAVRVDYNSGDMPQLNRVVLRVYTTIHPDVPVNQDIWVWFSYAENESWTHATTSVTPTPSARYPYTTQSRDILRIVETTPAVTKTVDKNPIKVGDSVTFTLTYSANGGTGIASTTNGYTIADTLPVGLRYVPGSSTIGEPAIAGQVLTWSLSDVPTNTANVMTYKATTNDQAVAGRVMQNEVVTKVNGATSATATATVTVSSGGTTRIGKSADQLLIPNLAGDGVGSGSWTVSLRSDDPTTQPFTDVIDILPYNGDGRGTSFGGAYSLDAVDAGSGDTVWYTTALPAALSDDPADASNGAAGDPASNTVGWTTDKPTDSTKITAVRVIGGGLAQGQTRSFRVVITTRGASGGDVFVNRAQARAGHTELVMRTSAPTTVSRYYAYELKKYVQDALGVWHDAQDTNEADWPTFLDGSAGDVHYRIVVTNTGEGDLTDIAVTDALFPSVHYSIASLASGQSDTHEFSENLNGTHSPVRNVATATTTLPGDSSQAGLPAVSDEANVVLDKPSPGFSLTKTADPVPGTALHEGDVVTYTVTGLNTGNTALDPTSISDDLSGVFDNATFVAGSLTTSTGDMAVLNGARLTWTGRLQPHQSVVITYRVVVQAGQGGQLVDNVVHGEATPPSPDQPEVRGTPIVPPDVETKHPIPVDGDSSPSSSPTATPTGVPTPVQHPEDNLASTGADVLVPGVVSVSLLAVGGVTMALWRGRRRRS